MFHFPGCPSHRLWIHLWMTAHYRSRVPPFGDPGIKAYLQLPQAFRSLSRPSSAISAMASTLRSYSLDLRRKLMCFSTSLAQISQIVCQFSCNTFLRLLRCATCFDLFLVFPCAVFKVRWAVPSPDCCRKSLPSGSAIQRPPVCVGSASQWVLI